MSPSIRDPAYESTFIATVGSQPGQVMLDKALFLLLDEPHKTPGYDLVPMTYSHEE
jgi:hypothetical protein